VPASELIGRAAALAEVAARLGLAVARELLPSYADGAWVAELAPLSDPWLVPVTVAVALGLTLPAGAESPERVASALGAKRLLLVLDNCEHLIDEALARSERERGAVGHRGAGPASKGSCPWSCGAPAASPACDITRVGPSRRVSFWRRSTAASRRASTPLISGPRGRCSAASV
jgi:hypothetical protein